MENNSEQTIQSVFSVTVEDDRFFTGGGRGQLLEEIVEAVMQAIPLMVMIGDEGSGKTAICRKLEELVKDDCQVVFFPRTVESFEDVIRIIATAVGITNREITDGSSLRDLLRAIAGLLLEENRKLLIIFDEAENIYLATLEPIRKMLGQMREAGVHLYVLFSGRPSFLENFDQLVICDFKAVEEKQFRLEPLTPEDIAVFINERLRLMSGNSSVKEVDEGVIRRITEISQGNFRMVKKLLQEVAAPQNDDTSFMVLLDTVATDEEESAVRWKWPPFSLKRMWRDFPLKLLLPWFSGIVCLLLILFFVLRSADNETEKIHPLQAREKAEKSVEAIKSADLKQTSGVVGVSGAVKQSQQSRIKDKEKKEVQEPVQSVVIRPVEKIIAAAQETVSEKKKKEQKARKAARIVLQKEPVIELHPSPYIKRKAGRRIEVRKNIIKMRSGTEVQKTTDKSTRQSPEQLYESRLAAGKRWRNGSRNNMYTIQLMALAAKDAEENFKQMLAQDDYRRVAHNFFIFRKKSRPQTLLVFYGEYPTMAEARSRRKSIPRFLQKHKPYAISIKGAIAKVRK